VRYINQELLKLDLSTPKRLAISDWDKARGLSQNALSHVYYKIVADSCGMFEDEVKADCKIQFGLPILFKSKTEYAYDLAEDLELIGFWSMNSEQQRKKIKKYKVTSVFKTKEMNKYIENMQHFFGVQGICLE